MRSTNGLLLIFLFVGLPLSLSAQLEVQPVVQFGHPGYVINRILLSPDGEVMATTDGEFLKLWDLSAGLELRSFRGDGGSLSEVVFSEDGNEVSYTSGKYLYQRSVLTGEILSRVERTEIDNPLYDDTYAPSYSLDSLLRTTYSPDGSLKAFAEDERILVSRTAGEDVIQTIPVGPPRPPANEYDIFGGYHRLTFSQDNEVLLVDSVLYTVATGIPAFQFSPQVYGIRVVQAIFLPDSHDLIFCNSVLPKSKPEAEEKEEEEEKPSFENLEQLYRALYQIGTDTGYAVLFTDLANGTIKGSPNTTSVTSTIWSRDGRYLITGHVNKTIKVWDLATGTEEYTIELRRADDIEAYDVFGIKAILQTDDDRHLIVGGSGSIPEDQLTMWDFATGERVKTFGAAIPPINLEARQTLSDSIILQEYKDYLFPSEQLNHREYGPYRILNLTNGQAPGLFPKFDSIAFSPRLDYYLVKSNESAPVVIYSSLYNEREARLEASDTAFEHLIFSNDARWVAGATATTIYLWEARTGRLRHQLPLDQLAFVHFVFDPNAEYLVCTFDPKRIRFYDLDTGAILFEKKPSLLAQTNDKLGVIAGKVESATAGSEENPIGGLLGLDRINRRAKTARMTSDAVDILVFKEYYDIEISLDGKYAAAWRDDLASVEFIDLESKKSIGLIKDKKIAFSNVAANLLANSELGDAVDPTYTLQYLREMLAFRKFTAISPQWDRVAIATKVFQNEDLRIRIEPIAGKKNKLFGKKKDEEGVIRLVDSEDFATGLTFSPDGRFIAASSNSLNQIRIWNVEGGRLLKTLVGHSGKIAFTPNGKNLVSTGWDRQMKVWDLETEQELYNFIAIKGQNDYVAMLPEGYYTTSRKNSRAIAFAYGKEAYPFDQFDIQFNRPDLLLERMQASVRTAATDQPNAELIDAYRRSYRKRLEKMKLSEVSFRTYISLPKVTVAEHPLVAKQRRFSLRVSARDEKYALNRLYATVNGVPVLAGGSLDLAGQNSTSYQGTLTFDLSEGENHLQVFVININGAASLKYNTRVKYVGSPAPKTLHIVTLGTASFQDSRFDLDYATKDLVDLRTYYGERGRAYDKVVYHRLEGADFTLAKFRALRNTLTQTRPDDVVVTFISTHGLLDEQFDYYLATHDVDFSNPAELGLAYAELENFLRDIGARNKLVFLDACHAGELDEEGLKQAQKARQIEGAVNFKSVRSTGWERLPGQQSFDLMKELFVDLRAGTGTTVIAGASAVAFAYEGREWNNSAFTYSLLRALREGTADRNNDGQITVSEIQEYLSYSVERLTNGGQRPISRVENVFNDFVIWEL